MKVLQVASSLRGGAGIAARRIHESILSHGEDSEIVSLRDRLRSNDFYDGAHLIGNGITAYTSSAVTYLQSQLVQNSSSLVTPFSLNIINKSWSLLKSVDVIHVHATYNLLNSTSFQRLKGLNIPTVVTMHDERLFTGACHYAGACKEYFNTCQHCPQVRSIFKKSVSKALLKNIEAFRGFENLKVVAPSFWLAQKAANSSLLKGHEIKVVRNPIPNLFSATSSTRRPGPLRIGFSAASFQNPNKGFVHLVNTLNMLVSRNMDFELTLIGRGDTSGLNSKINVIVCHAQSEVEIAKIMSDLDWLIVPSEQDNLPNVIGEALMSGIKVLGSTAGGIPEIASKTTDILNYDSFSHSIANLDFDYDRGSISGTASQMFSYGKISNDYLKLYKSF